MRRLWFLTGLGIDFTDDAWWEAEIAKYADEDENWDDLEDYNVNAG